MTIIDAIRDARLFRPWFKRPETWAAWMAFFKALYALPMTPAELEVFKACTALEASPAAPYKEAFVIASRRSGKSSAAAILAAHLAISQDWRKKLAPGEVAWVFIVANDKAQAGLIKKYVSGIFHLTPTLRKLVLRETQEAIELRAGVNICVKTSSFRTIRGYSCAAVILEEAAFYRSEDSANPDREILAAVRPALANLDGLLLVISSPYGKAGILYDAFRRWHGKPDGPLVWKESSPRMMNPTTRQAVIDKALAEDPAAARSEWFSEFREDLEQIFSLEAVERCVVPGRSELPPAAGIQYLGFIDPSGGRADSFTLGIAHRSKTGRVVLDVLREKRPPFRPEDVVEEYSKLMRDYRISSIRADAYAGEWVSAAFDNHKITVRPADMPKSDLYLELLPRVSDGAVELLDSKRLVAQLTGLERRTRPGGRDKVDHGPGGHDDLANAAAGVIVLASAEEPVGTVVATLTRDVMAIDGPGGGLDPIGRRLLRSAGGRG